MSALEHDVEVQDVEIFRRRARAWIRANLRPVSSFAVGTFVQEVSSDDDVFAMVSRDREIQRMLFDAGLAGICVPREYGGQGLSRDYQRALNEELVGYEYPVMLQSPTMATCAAVLLEFGTDEQKRRHLPAILRGEEIWVQFLSEPSGGSDVAGSLTSAVRDGDEWVLNGSKVWTTGAWWSDWALCLARTNWDVPKHRGLTVFMLPIGQTGIEVHRIEMLNGNKEFCQEYLTDVRVPDTDRIGEVDQGWTVGVRWMFHERMAMGHNSPLVTQPPTGGHVRADARLLAAVAADAGRLDDPRIRDLIGEGHMLQLVATALQQRISEGIASGRMSDQAASIGRLFSGVVASRITAIEFEVAGATGAAWNDDDGTAGGTGVDLLMRQLPAIAGGTLEMARNVISERVLGMPREQAFDRDVPFRDVPRGPGTQH
ncbi:MAG: acyl-CoA dehydrogenase family protein [Actinobacteria bacterium]|nr:acyl-CoA dehydrogenase family protein [Actinomycetota bacterium]